METGIKEGGENTQDMLTGILIRRNFFPVEELDEFAYRGQSINQSNL
jgi:hypothetical protein